MAKAKPSPYDVETVPVDQVRPLRWKYLRPGEPEDAVCYKSDEEATCVHLGVRDESGALIGVGSMHPENRVAGQGPHRHPGMRFRGVAVEETHRRKGVAGAILSEMVRRAQDGGMQEVWANGRTNQIAMYKRHGFKVMSQEFEIPRLGAHFVIVRRLKQKGGATASGPSASEAPETGSESPESES